MPGQTTEEKVHRTTEVRRSGARRRGDQQDRAGNNEQSCSLLSADRPRNVRRPINAFGPIHREPQHRLFEGTRREIAIAVGNAIQRRSSIQHNRRQALAANPACLSKDIGDRYELFSKCHGARECGISSALSTEFIRHDFFTQRG